MKNKRIIDQLCERMLEVSDIERDEFAEFDYKEETIEDLFERLERKKKNIGQSLAYRKTDKHPRMETAEEECVEMAIFQAMIFDKLLMERK